MENASFVILKLKGGGRMIKSRKLLFFLIIITSLLINNCRCKARIKNGDTRESAVAGAFYPADKMKLKKMINDFLSNVRTKENNANLRALICPHAGYIYSGPIAASGFSLLRGKSYKKTFIIGPSHYFALKKPSIPKVKYYKTRQQD